MNFRNTLFGVLVALAFCLAAPAPAQEHASPPAAAQHETASDHAAHDDETNIFAGGLGNMIWTTIIFLIVVIILGKSAWPQILKGLNDREQAIRTSLEDARRERLESERLLAEYKRRIDKAREEATAIVEEGRRDAEVVRKRIQDEARVEAEEMAARAKREIQLATDAAVKQLYDQTAALAVEIAGRVVRKELKADDHRQLVAESLEKMQRAGGELN